MVVLVLASESDVWSADFMETPAYADATQRLQVSEPAFGTTIVTAVPENPVQRYHSSVRASALRSDVPICTASVPPIVGLPPERAVVDSF